MSVAMRDSMIKDVEVALKGISKYPEETYSFYPGHEWINSLLEREVFDLTDHFDKGLPEMTYRDFIPILEELLDKLKEADLEWIAKVYSSMNWCCILNFTSIKVYDEFGY